jgi:RNA-binding protein
LNNATRKRLRQIAHHLDPVVIIGDSGVSEAVIKETNRALLDHELIKVKINAGDRDDRVTLGDSLTDACGAESVQRIGKVLVIYRHNPEADPALSNLSRAGASRPA